MSEPIAYLSGAYVPFSEARLSVADFAVTRAAAATEMVRTFRHAPYRLDDHLQRLGRSIQALGLSSAEIAGPLPAIVERVVAHNARLIDREDDLGISILVTPGIHSAYLGSASRTDERQRGFESEAVPLPQTSSDQPIAPQGGSTGSGSDHGGSAHGGPTVCVHTAPLAFHRWARAYRDGVHLVTPSVRGIPAASIDPHIKTRNRLHWYLADREVRKHDPQAMPLLLDLDGYVTETDSGNVLLFDGDRLKTPPPESVLEGVSERVLLEFAAAEGLQRVTGKLTVSDLLAAGELLLTSTPYAVLPVTRVNDRPVADGRPGKLFERIISLWSESVGVDIVTQAQQWTTAER